MLLVFSKVLLVFPRLSAFSKLLLAFPHSKSTFFSPSLSSPFSFRVFILVLCSPCHPSPKRVEESLSVVYFTNTPQHYSITAPQHHSTTAHPTSYARPKSRRHRTVIRPWHFMNDKIVLHNQNGDATIEPLARILAHHSATFGDIASSNEQCVPLRPPKRVANERFGDVAHQDGLFPPHAVRADPAGLRVSKDNTHRNAQHAGPRRQRPRRALPTASDGRPG